MRPISLLPARPLALLLLPLVAGAALGVELAAEGGSPLYNGLAAAPFPILLALCCLTARGELLLSCWSARLCAAAPIFRGWQLADVLLTAALGVTSCCLGLGAGSAAGPPGHDPALEEWLANPAEALGGRQALLVEGVVESAALGPAGSLLTVRVELRESRPLADLTQPAAPLRLELASGAELHRGDRFRGLARIGLPAPLLNPGGRDRRRELAVRGLFARGTLETDGLAVLSRGPAPFRWLDRLRRKIAGRCRLLATSRDRGEVLAALAVGDRSGLGPELTEQLSVTGLVHVLASCGLHLALAASLGRRASLALLLRLPRPPLAALPISAACGLACAALHALLLWPSWALLRALASSALAAAALCCGRRSDPLTTLALSTAFVLLCEPAASHDLGLQLSVAGLFGLVALGPRLRALLPALPARRPGGPGKGLRPWSRARLAGWLSRLGEAVLHLLCASAGASICTAPLLAATFHRASWLAPIANAVGLWPGLAALPLAAVAGPLDQLSPGLALPLLFAADQLAGLLLGAAARLARLPLGSVAAATPSPLGWLLWAALLGSLLTLPARRGSRSGSRPPGRRTPLLLASACAGLLLLPIGREATAGASRLRVTFLAVGQGDATLVRFPDGSALLVDAGGDLRGLPAPNGPGLVDPGARDILPALAALGVARLDRAVLTHPHPDHAGGFPTLLAQVPLRELWSTGEPGAGRLGDTIRRLASERGVRLVVPVPGTSIQAGGARLEVLAPRAWSAARKTNDNSIVLRIVFGETALLLAGDAEALEEAELAQSGLPLRAQVLKAGHHGSRTSSTDAWLRAVSPDWVVFSAGAQNPFGFPHADVVERVRGLGARTITTAEGAIAAESDGQTWTLRRWRESG